MTLIQRIKARARVAEQREWIDSHGGSRAAYVAYYGSATDPNHYGDGGEAIYAADVDYLNRLESEARA